MSPAANTLAAATSPYLRQHADNPVHWQQWTSEALTEAARRDVPILLSIGYAACHWCHVMAHESFEDDDVAAAMNADFVCIKVDREERPDLDAVYMNATVALTGQGGWPMTCFLTPDGRPFFCGTYYPKPQFLQLLAAVAETWRDRRGEVEQASDQIAGELRRMAAGLPGGGPEVGAAVVRSRRRAVLARRGRRARRLRAGAEVPAVGAAGSAAAHLRAHRSTAPLAAVERTGAAMARGGIYDQLAGGFARYSVDADWVVPHFEKMLYDNALLLRAYAHWARRTGDPLALRVAAQTAAFLLNDLADGDMFTSSLDADAAGVGGLDLRVDARPVARGARRGRRPLGGNCFRGHRAGHVRARRRRCCSCSATPTTRTRFERVRAALLAARLTRVQPAATTRSSPRGTAWRSPRWPRPASRWTTRSCSTPRRDVRAALRRPASRRRPAAAGQPRWRGRRQRGDPRGPRRAGDRVVDAVPADRRAAWLATATGTARHGAGALRRPGPAGPLVRHRRRRRAADGAARRSARRRDAVGGVADRRSAADRRRIWSTADRAARYGRRPPRRWLAHSPLLAQAPRSAGTGWPWPRPRCAGRCRSPCACDPADSPTARRRPAHGARRGDRRRRPGGLVADCWPGATGARVPTPPMCAAAGSATCRSPARGSRRRAGRAV